MGAIFSLVAAGVTIVYGCVWLPNASNGQFFLLAALMAWTFTLSYGWSTLAASLIVIVLGVLLAVVLELVLIRRLYNAPNRNVAYFVITLGMTQILSGVFSLTYAKWSDQFSVPPVIEGITMLGPFPISNNRLLAMGSAWVCWGCCLRCFVIIHTAAPSGRCSKTAKRRHCAGSTSRRSTDCRLYWVRPSFFWVEFYLHLPIAST